VDDHQSTYLTKLKLKNLEKKKKNHTKVWFISKFSKSRNRRLLFSKSNNRPQRGLRRRGAKEVLFFFQDLDRVAVSSPRRLLQKAWISGHVALLARFHDPGGVRTGAAIFFSFPNGFSSHFSSIYALSNNR